MNLLNLFIDLLLLAGLVYLISNIKTKIPTRKNEVIIDTSGVIDGRLLLITKAGFSPGKLLFPKFVLEELQKLADNGNDIKRSRAREGMAAIQELQSIDDVETEVLNTEISNEEPVDRRLIELAKARNSKLYTVDYNLTQVARIEGVNVLNVNELSKAVRPLVLPGETIKIKLTQKGKEPKQGVGYLENGTMVVVDKAHNLIGKEIEVEATHFIQTESGKILFAKKNSNGKYSSKKPSKKTKSYARSKSK